MTTPSTVPMPVAEVQTRRPGPLSVPSHNVKAPMPDPPASQAYRDAPPTPVQGRTENGMMVYDDDDDYLSLTDVYWLPNSVKTHMLAG